MLFAHVFWVGPQLGGVWYQMLSMGRCDEVQIGGKASLVLDIAICPVPRGAVQFSCMPLDVGTVTVWPWACFCLCRV